MNKISKVTKCTFISEWVNQMGSTVYYHVLTLENGDTGSCGRVKKCPDDMSEGAKIEYTITEDKKIKFVKQITNNNMENKYGKKSNYAKTPEDFLGYAYAYAKDMVVAGKTSKEDVENLQFIAKEIYKHITELLENGNQE